MVANMGERHDIIIIGAGISGLALAFYCARAGLSALVLEKSARTGGAFHSHHFRDGTRDFWLEMGAHTCYNSYQNLVEIIEECGIADRMLPRQKVPFKFLANDQLKSLLSRLSFPALLSSVPRLLLAKQTGQSVASYYSTILGRRNYQNLLRHVFNGVISQEADGFPADMLFKKRPRRMDTLRSFTLKGGLQSITEAIASYRTIKVLNNMEVCEIGHQHGSYRLNASDGSSFEAEVLALACGSSATARLLKALFPEIAQELSGIPTVKVESLGVIINKDMTALPPVAGIIAGDDVFYSVVSRDTVPDDTFRGFTFHFKPDILGQQDKLKRIGEVLRVDPARFVQTTEEVNTVPALRVGHDKVIAVIDRSIARKRLLLTGNYFSGLAIEDCVTRSFSEFYRLKMLRSTEHFDSSTNY